MSNVLRIFSPQEALPTVEILDRHVHDFETPFLNFSTLGIKIDGAKATVLFTTLKVDELRDNSFLRSVWMRESVCGYLTSRTELVDNSKARLALSPTLVKHIGDHKNVIIIDEIFIGDVQATVACYQAVLLKLCDVLREEGLVITIDWVSYIEYASDTAPQPVAFADMCGFEHTGLMWIARQCN